MIHSRKYDKQETGDSAVSQKVFWTPNRKDNACQELCRHILKVILSPKQQLIACEAK
jgi:hypothetical protein